MHLIFKYIIKYIGMLFFSAQAEYSNLIFCWFHPKNILVLFLEFIIISIFIFFNINFFFCGSFISFVLYSTLNHC